MSFISKIAKLFFFVLYSIIRALVIIGEITEKILLLPLQLLLAIIKLGEVGLVKFAQAVAHVDKKLKRISAKVEKQEAIIAEEKAEEEKAQEAIIEQKETIPVQQESISTAVHIEPAPAETTISETPTELDKPKAKELKPILPAFFAGLVVNYKKVSNALIAFFKTFAPVVKPFKQLTHINKAFAWLFAAPQKAVKFIFNGFIRFLTRISFLRKPVKTSLATASESVKLFNKSWFQLFRMSFGSSFKYFIFGFIFCLTVIFIQQSYIFVTNLPSPKTIGKVNFQQSTHLYDRNGKLLYEIYRDQNRTPVKLSSLPKYVSQASIAIEDKTFYNHHGIAIVGGMLRAVKDTLRSGDLQGGSTLTQQLVKSALLTPERTIDRKLKEIFLALWTERLYSKDQILEMYLNQVPYGGAAYGIEEASKAYFAKSAKDLTISEAALLAGLPQAPSLFSPYINPEGAIRRRNDVLGRMEDLGYITEQQKQEALNAKLTIQPPVTKIRAPHFVFYTKSELEKEYGIQKVEEGGFKVTTTLDLDVQEEAEKILRDELEKIKGLNVTNGGILVTKPKTGEIIAMVGSVDYFAKPYGAYNVTTTLRQPGSSLKPAVYALNLEKGMTAATIYQDAPLAIRISDTETYKPNNYDLKFHGNVTMRSALANSYNIPAVKAVQIVGVEEYVNFATRLGIDTWKDPSQFGLSIALGGGEVSMIDISQVFGVFANEGKRVEMTAINEMTDHEGTKLYTHQTKEEKVLNEGIAYVISDMLSDNNARVPAFGTRSALEIPGYKVAVKTGTTDYKKDNWTVGYTPEYLVSVWVGNNDNTPMNQALASGITGAAPIWQRTMQYLLQNKVKDRSALEFKKPNNVIVKPCFGNPNEVFVSGTENSVPCAAPVYRPNVTGQQNQWQQLNFPGNNNNNQRR